MAVPLPEPPGPCGAGLAAVRQGGLCSRAVLGARTGRGEEGSGTQTRSAVAPRSWWADAPRPELWDGNGQEVQSEGAAPSGRVGISPWAPALWHPPAPPPAAVCWGGRRAHRPGPGSPQPSHRPQALPVWFGLWHFLRVHSQPGLHLGPKQGSEYKHSTLSPPGADTDTSLRPGVPAGAASTALGGEPPGPAARMSRVSASPWGRRSRGPRVLILRTCDCQLM